MTINNAISQKIPHKKYNGSKLEPWELECFEFEDGGKVGNWMPKVEAMNGIFEKLNRFFFHD